MELKVQKPFIGKVEKKVFNQGDTLYSDDVERVNVLVGGGFCRIVSLSDENAADNASIEFQGKQYDVEALKTGLIEIGASCSPNAKAKGVANALAKLTDEQAEALSKLLNHSDD